MGDGYGPFHRSLVDPHIDKNTDWLVVGLRNFDISQQVGIHIDKISKIAWL